jgi:N-acyl-D-aspartate/D-glutamate deacylase
MAYDLVIKGGLIVDGSGRPAAPGEVAVADGRIAAVGKVDGTARRTIDAEGRAVSPGFVDVHTHYDAQLCWDAHATPSCFHGVTSVLIGNCGFTLAPCRPGGRDYLTGLFSSAEQVSKETLNAGVPFDWESYPDFLRWLERRGLGVNVMAQIGHSALRDYVMGEAALERAATEDEARRMAQLVEEAVAAGAMGFTTSQAPHQVDDLGRHIPTFHAGDEEVIALAEALKRQGKGIIGFNPRTKIADFNRQDRDFMVKLTEISGGMISWNDLSERPTAPGLWRDLLDYMEGEIKRGHPVYAVARCQPNNLRFDLHDLPALFNNLRPWVEFYRSPDDAKRATLRDPEGRERLVRALDGHPFFHLAGVQRGATDETRALVGRKLTEIGAERGVNPAEALLDIALADDLKTVFAFFGFSGANEEAAEAILKSPATLVGISDAGAHVHTFATFDYATYFLEHWMREKGAFTLEEAVRELTSYPARVFGLTDRGRLAPGLAADITIFDPQTVAPLDVEIRNDLPGGGTRTFKEVQGLPWVIVNGEPIVENGALTGAKPGKVLSF